MIDVFLLLGISIHKALAGLDKSNGILDVVLTVFQSTRPSRASTVKALEYDHKIYISIHKALAGLDLFRLQASAFYMISIHKALAGLDI